MYTRLVKQSEGLKQEHDVNDVLQLKVLDEDTKFALEKSPIYIGYKLMLQMRLFLEGRKFPYGNLPPHDWQTYTRQIAALSTSNNFVSALLNLDSSCFFKVILPLFSGMAYVHLKNQIIEGEHEYTPEKVLESINNVVANLTKASGGRTDLNKSYDRFCLEIVIGHNSFIKEQQARKLKVDHIRFDSGRIYEATLGAMNDIAIMIEDDPEELYSKVYDETTKLINSVYRVKFIQFPSDSLHHLLKTLDRLKL